MDEPRWLDESEARAWRSYVRMSEQLKATLARELLRDTGLSEADYAVLVELSEATGGRMRMTDLACALAWSKSRLSHQVARMEERGLVKRRGCPTDARGFFAAITPRGLRELQAAAPHHLAGVREHFVDRLSPREIDMLSAMCERILADLVGGSSTPTDARTAPTVRL